MKKVIFLLVLCQAVWAQDAPKKADTGEHHEFIISNFRTEGGVTLPVARIEYGTYGHLNAAHDNVILLPSHYMADYHGYEWLIGPGHALDPSQLFPGRDRNVWQRALFFAQQYAGAISRSALSADDHPRQRGSCAPAADRRTAKSRTCALSSDFPWDRSRRFNGR